MALIYASSQEELEQAFTTMGFVEGTGNDVGKWFFNADTYKMGYFVLTYPTSTTNIYPIVYHDSSGQTRNLYSQMSSSNPILKIEYHKLYNGGVCFRWVSSTSVNIGTANFMSIMTVAIFADNDGYSVIFNTGSNINTLTLFYDDMQGITNNLPFFTYNQQIVTTEVVILSKVYDNRDGIIDGEVYNVLTPVPNSSNSYFATVDNVDYIITFGVGNAPNGRFAFRLAESA